MTECVIETEQQLLTDVVQPLAQDLKAGDVIYLQGNLGAGKTTLTRHLLQCMGHQGAVKSPTYTLVETYPLSQQLQLHHFDLYRLHDPMELDMLGIRDYANAQSICVIEWPDKGRGFIPKPTCVIRIELNGNMRHITMDGPSEVD